MQTKTQQVRRLLDDGKIKEALRIAKGFRLGKFGEEKRGADRITQAYESLVHPNFYSSIGENNKKNICLGVSILRNLLKEDV